MSDYPRIGVVLSSGGVRGVYAHTGFLLALEKMAIPITAMAGCSAGALVGGFVASGTPLQEWADVLKKLECRDFWTPDSTMRVVWRMTVNKGRGYTGLSSTEAPLAFTRRNLSVQTFEECQYPFHALAINLSTGCKTVFSQGELAPRMMASAAIPVLYRPVEINGEYYCDGALVDMAPTDAICCKHNLDVVIVHHVSQHLDPQGDVKHAMQRSWSMLDIVTRLIFRQRPWYLSEDQLTIQRCPCNCGAVVIAIEPSLPILSWPVTKGGSQVLAKAGEQTGALLSPHIEALLNDPKKLFPLLSIYREHKPAHEKGKCGNGN